MEKIQKTRPGRQERVSQLIADYLEKNDYSDRNHLITVFDVQLNRTLDYAKVYISIFPEKDNKEIFNKIEKDLYQIQSYVNKHLICKDAPKIELILSSIEQKIFELN